MLTGSLQIFHRWTAYCETGGSPYLKQKCRNTLQVYPTSGAVRERPFTFHAEGFFFPNQVASNSKQKLAVKFNPREPNNVKAKVLWTQLGLVNYEALDMAKKAGLKVVMDRCPKIELAKQN